MKFDGVGFLVDLQSRLATGLFKYGPMTNLSRTLQNQTLGFELLCKLNDIYEDDFRLEHYFKSDDDRKQRVIPPGNAVGLARTKVKALIDTYRVTCFSRSAIISLMWSHYADDHEGVCYWFDKTAPNKIFLDHDTLWGNVEYSSQLPTISVFQEYTKDRMLKSLTEKVVLTKPLEWAYEQEVRFWNTGNTPAVQFDPAALKAVIVGRRTPDEDIATIKNKIKQYNIDKKQAVELWYAKRIPSSFNLGITYSKSERDSAEKGINDAVPVMPVGGTGAITD
jgi:hypothetical protein